MKNVRLHPLTVIASLLVREYAALREELTRVNEGEPGYERYREVFPESQPPCLNDHASTVYSMHR
jgi:hypothetical protein